MTDFNTIMYEVDRGRARVNGPEIRDENGRLV